MGEKLRTEEMKSKIEEEYRKKMAGSNISSEEQNLLMAELDAKMANINDAIGAEAAAQNATLEELRAKRKAKKDKLRGKMEKVTEKKQLEDEHYRKKLDEIAWAAENEYEFADMLAEYGEKVKSVDA